MPTKRAVYTYLNRRKYLSLPELPKKMRCINLKLLPVLLITCSVLLVVFTQCTKRKVHDRFPIPPTTHAEREFFGCKINGLPFIPKAPSESGLGSCTYSSAYEGRAGYRFQLVSNSHQSDCGLITVSITLDSIELKEGRTYDLVQAGNKNNYGTYTIVSDCSGDKLEMHTTKDAPGEFRITKFDPALGFVSGSFSFTVKDSSGNNYRISEGLFDQLFTN